MMSNTIKKTIITVSLISLLSIVLLFFFRAPVTAYDEEVRCHGCKEKDLSLVDKHKVLGYEGCFDCHDKPTANEHEKNKNKKKKG